ncbi:Membrane-bound lytic murein transglycosylase D precursor [Desulfosporosinus sp. I2]|uniref:LysM peptidoglycan-binding domain-containing protein n=1 Tax=Desulfosporosinus sp. I2 TaxID=1617025 RepID=UPI00061E6EDF|nr:LysM peptidoglycan-binding domain-containing protein [Desulfosporosinus sp. I2]KJR45703.1 Membrane-bound lytic murein transglycosylase D precursor [Desulfosporosinus sp. I2]
MELRSVAYNPIAAPGMGGMQGMPGMSGMQGMPGMSGMQGMPGMSGMQGMPGMPGMPGMQGMQGMQMAGGAGMYPQGGFVNLDVDMDPGFVSIDVDNPMACAPCGPHMMHYQHHCPMPTPVPTPEPEVYVVKKGDTIYKIAKRYGTTMQAIILANNLRNPDLIYPGQILFIPGVSEFRGSNLKG